MNISFSKSIRSLAMLLMLLAIAMPAFSQQPTLPKNSDGYYIINTDEDYETFRQIVATGNPYANAVLTDNITVKNPIGAGDEQFHYRGTFDGKEYTVTLSNFKGNGLFEYTKPDCVVRNLKVTGTIKSSAEYAGSIVCDATGTKIEKCISDVTVSGKRVGGIVGISRGECFLENCAYIGTISGTTQISGLVGINSQMISIKSCYAFPKSTANISLIVDEITYVETSLNNYYCRENVANQTGTTADIAKMISSSEISSGSLCYKLNKNGKNGVVWYQHDNHPYPFKGANGNGKMVTCVDDALAIGNEAHTHNFAEGICNICGAINPNVKIEPLQNSGKDTEFNTDEIFVGYLRYNLTAEGTATVKGTHHYQSTTPSLKIRDAIAVHIPETINYEGVEYKVNKIDEKAFQGSIMKYCYVPKTVESIEDNAFVNCNSLTELHIADGPIIIENEIIKDGPALWLGRNTSPTLHNDELFFDSPLKTVYIGRNLKWNADAFNDAPFEDRDKLEKIFWGPRVTRVGNSRYGNDPLDGHNDELFANSESIISKIYFMGDETSMKHKDLRAFNKDGMNKATDVYVNRNIFIGEDSETEIDTEDYVAYEEDGIFMSCKNATFGPFVKYIGKNMFGGHADYNENRTLNKIDFSNAFNLEEIKEDAFKYSGKNTALANGGLFDLSNTKVWIIRKHAFRTCSFKNFILGKHLTDIEEKAFYNILNANSLTIPSSVVNVDKEAFVGSYIEELIFEYSEIPLVLPEGGESFSPIQGYANLIFMDRDVQNLNVRAKTWKIGSHMKVLRSSMADEPVYSQNEFTSKMYIEYSEEPLVCEDGIKIKANFLFLDREITNSESKYNISFIRNSTSTLKELNFGINYTLVHANMFEGTTALEALFVPSTVIKIEKEAFKGCTKLKELALLGNIEVGESAFENCTSLNHLYVLGEDVTLNDYAFKNCHNIEDITLGFTKDPGVNKSNKAFDQEAYDNTALSNSQNIHFKSTPWSLFMKKSTILVTNFYHGTGTEGFAPYDRASVQREIAEDKFELLYLPFQMDSYYFGSDAEIYRFDIDNFSNMTYNADNEAYMKYNFKFDSVNINDESRSSWSIPGGDNAYLVKAKRGDTELSSYFSLYDQEGIYTMGGFGMNGMSGKVKMNAQSGSLTLKGDEYAYICDEGVLKSVNGALDTKPCGIVLYRNSTDDEQVVFEIPGLLSSKTDLEFNANLEGYSSFYAADYNYIAPKWCEVYIVTSTQDNIISMEKIEDNTITKGQAVILKSNRDLGENDITEYLTYATHGSSASYTNNILKGISVATPANQLSDEGYVYVLSCTNDSDHRNTGFYKLSGEREMPAGKAYLDPSGLSPQQTAKSCLFVCNDFTTTGIKSAPAVDRNQGIYDLMGRRMKEAGYKGIYIINNKKVVIK